MSVINYSAMNVICYEDGLLWTWSVVKGGLFWMALMWTCSVMNMSVMMGGLLWTWPVMNMVCH